jgi:hypothetical protein
MIPRAATTASLLQELVRCKIATSPATPASNLALGTTLSNEDLLRHLQPCGTMPFRTRPLNFDRSDSMVTTPFRAACNPMRVANNCCMHTKQSVRDFFDADVGIVHSGVGYCVVLIPRR